MAWLDPDGQNVNKFSTVIHCVDLDAEVEFFTHQLGFRVHLVTPADDPRRIVLGRDGGCVELRRAVEPVTVHLRLIGDTGPTVVTTPGGSTVEIVVESDGFILPDSVPTLTVVGPPSVAGKEDDGKDGGGGNGDGDGGFGVGRAGMEYRDLLPDRWGGRFIASHIRIGEGGDVADWVHFHRIRFQMIYIASGWVDVVYEDQGEPFRMDAGDCVLQPPQIRHRVLRSSAGAEVIEIGCPAEHDTIADHDLVLPTSTIRGDRDFGGQRFVRHRAPDAPTEQWIDPSLNVRDTGVGEATDGLAGAVAVSADTASPAGTRLTHDGEFVMIVGLSGTAAIAVVGHGEVSLAPRSSLALPAESVWSWSDRSLDHESLLVSLPADTVRSA